MSRIVPRQIGSWEATGIATIPAFLFLGITFVLADVHLPHWVPVAHAVIVSLACRAAIWLTRS